MSQLIHKWLRKKVTVYMQTERMNDKAVSQNANNW